MNINNQSFFSLDNFKLEKNFEISPDGKSLSFIKDSDTLGLMRTSLLTQFNPSMRTVSANQLNYILKEIEEIDLGAKAMLSIADETLKVITQPKNLKARLNKYLVESRFNLLNDHVKKMEDIFNRDKKSLDNAVRDADKAYFSEEVEDAKERLDEALRERDSFNPEAIDSITDEAAALFKNLGYLKSVINDIHIKLKTLKLLSHSDSVDICQQLCEQLRPLTKKDRSAWLESLKKHPALYQILAFSKSISDHLNNKNQKLPQTLGELNKVCAQVIFSRESMTIDECKTEKYSNIAESLMSLIGAGRISYESGIRYYEEITEYLNSWPVGYSLPDTMPDLSITGETLRENIDSRLKEFHIQKLSKNDFRVFILGELTGSCFNIPDGDEGNVEKFLKSKNIAAYILTDNKGDIVGKSIVGRTSQGEYAAATSQNYSGYFHDKGDDIFDLICRELTRMGRKRSHPIV